MLPKRFSLLFYVKKPKNYVKGNLPIYIRITVDAKRIELSTQRDCEPGRWNSSSGRVNGVKEEVKSLNIYLDALQARIYEIYRSFLDKSESITADNFKKKLRGEIEQSRMILEIFQQHNDRIATLVGRDFSAGTLERYKTAMGHTKNFILWKYNKTDFEITKLNYEFISEYAFWLKSIRNCNQNSTMKYLANFKKIVLICIKNGWLQQDPFLGFKLSKREVERLLSTALEILNRYADHAPCINEEKMLPVLSIQKMNAYLKEIADVCVINKKLTFHVARHTFATTVTLNNGIPIESVSKMLGHKNLRMTQHHAKILDKKVSEDMMLLKNKFTIKPEL